MESEVTRLVIEVDEDGSAVGHVAGLPLAMAVGWSAEEVARKLVEQVSLTRMEREFQGIVEEEGE